MPNRLTESLSVRVYYEDTDFSGRVYHASYLRFLERARTELLRQAGFTNRELADSTGVVFAVRKLQIEYLSPSMMDDVLRVDARIEKVRAASLEFEQFVFRGDQQIASAKVLVAVLRSGRPSRVPDALRRALEDVGYEPRRGQDALGSKARSKRAASESIRSPNLSSRS